MLEGRVQVPGDKSNAHRALMLAALADGDSQFTNLPRGADVLSTAECVRLLGARVTVEDAEARVSGDGQLLEPARELDAGNSGTTMRLMSGILAGQSFSTVLTGDASLRRRPMGRVIEPLGRMGASIHADDGRAPLTIEGRPLHGIRYTLPVASAQVKSAVLLAGLFAEGETSVTEVIPSRDHTERMLTAVGVPVQRNNGTATIGRGRLRPFDLTVPGDVSSAAFFLAGAALTGGELVVEDVGLNPTRTGLLDVLRRMGIAVETSVEAVEAGEPRGTIRLHGRVEAPVTIEAEEVPLLIDELPLVALLATQAQGTSTIRGAAELRLKESDRIATVTATLTRLGADVEELPDGFMIRGPSRLRGATLAGGSDHRLAMMATIAGLAAEGHTVVDGVEVAAVSYPGFERDLARVGGSIEPA
jgi:3-phosphoshikimate 1-carboxyvinyltransferase